MSSIFCNPKLQIYSHTVPFVAVNEPGSIVYSPIYQYLTKPLAAHYRDHRSRAVTPFYQPLLDKVVNRTALAISSGEHRVLVVLETRVCPELITTIATSHHVSLRAWSRWRALQDLPNMLEVWLRLCVAVNKPRKTSARRECAGLRLPLPLEPEVLAHSAYIVSGGLEVAVAIVLAELIKRYCH